MTPDLDDSGPDDQDQSEVFDEDNQSIDDAGAPTADMSTLEEIVDVYDVTTAVGDSDDDAGAMAEDLDDDEIIDLETDAALADTEDDELAARMPEALDSEPEGGEEVAEVLFDAEAGIDDGDRMRSVAASDEAPLVYVGDQDDADQTADPAALEADHLADDDIAALGYAEDSLGEEADGVPRAPTHLDIEVRNGLWVVSRNGQPVREYGHADRAVHEASELARELRRSGEPAVVHLHAADGKVIAVTDADSPRPPPLDEIQPSRTVL
jgi:hypothetical protein